jgi:hypothetical protein
MRMKLIIVFLLSVFLLSFSAGDVAAFRCGSGLVSTGDTKTKVLVTCGKPTSKEYKCKDNWTNKKAKCDKIIEVWYYNCGDNDFIYALSFENKTLTAENTEGRGRGKSDCKGK